MADRVSASITTGGKLPATLVLEFIALTEQERLSTEWNGDPFAVCKLPEGAALDLMAQELA